MTYDELIDKGYSIRDTSGEPVTDFHFGGKMGFYYFLNIFAVLASHGYISYAYWKWSKQKKEPTFYNRLPKAHFAIIFYILLNHFSIGANMLSFYTDYTFELY